MSESPLLAHRQGMTTQAAPFRTGTFADPIEQDTLRDEETVDCHGTDLIGEDDDGLWWGTNRAAWVLCPNGDTVFVVEGTIGTSVWTGHFIAGSGEQALDYARDRRVNDAALVESTPLGAVHDLLG